MGKVSKTTKKFQNKHLKRTIEHRKEVQKHNKKYGDRKKSKTTSNAPESVKPSGPKEVFDDMSVEDFFEGGFEAPKEKKFRNKVTHDSGESSDEEDPEAVEQDMKKLAENDPEFYQYLQNNDKDLLDFDGVNPLDAMSESDDEEEEEGDNKTDVKKSLKSKKSTKTANDDDDEEVEVTDPKAEKIEITSALVKKWSSEMNKPSIKLIKNVAIAFKAAVNIQNAQDEDYRYTITNASVFHSLMILALQKVPVAIQKIAKYRVHNGSRIVAENKNAKSITAILKSIAGAYITLLQDITNTETAALVLISLQEVFPFYLSHRRLVKQMINSVVQVWATTLDIETQIATFAFLNNLSKEYPKSLLETVLKLTYTTFLQSCRQTNVHTIAKINFCKNSAVELYGINPTMSYQIGFEYVRQLAIHLRNSINATSNAKEGYKAIYNWQYCHSLDFWSRVLTQHSNVDAEALAGKESVMRQLIYPLVQVTLGAIRLIPTAQFFPLRFYLIRSLIRLLQSTGVYIPLFPLLAEILTSTAFTKPPKKSTLEAVDFEHSIKVNQAYLGTKQYQDGLCDQFIELTGEIFVLHAKSIAFPELVTPAILALKRYSKKSKNFKFNKQLQQLIEKLTSNATFITSKRSNVEYGPSNKKEVQNFLNDLTWEKTPLGQYVSVQRKTKEERLRILREALEEEKARKKQQEKDEEEEDEEEEDEEEEEEEE